MDIISPEIVANENALVSLVAQFPSMRLLVENRVFPQGAEWRPLTPGHFHDPDAGRIFAALTGTSEPRRTSRSSDEENAVAEALHLSRIVYVQGKVRQ